MSDYTQPDISFARNATGFPDTAAGWFCEGYTFGWNHPGVTPEAPAPLREDLLSAYFQGVSAAQQALDDALKDYTGPIAAPDPGGENYDELERRWAEAWSEFINHREDPHIEIEMPEIQVGPPAAI